MRSNPFHELYVGDRLSSQEFVTAFSTFLVPHAEALFLPGNIVITGRQGSGKSMLLSLLKPGVRLEYARAATEFPVPKAMRRFIGAGINLAHSSAIDFGYRRLPGTVDDMSLLFGDFVNYSLVLDLIRSLDLLRSEPTARATDLEVRFGPDEKGALLAVMRRDSAWLGTFEHCDSWEDAVCLISDRLNAYVAHLHGNVDLDARIMHSKTSVGVPPSTFTEALKKVGIIHAETNVFLHIDQYEELANIERADAAGIDYRSIINRALARRDPNVSYRIASRSHAWNGHGKILGTNAKLEEERDYKSINLDQKLQRSENSKTWIFQNFAADVFARRLQHAGLAPSGSDGRKLMDLVFGTGLGNEEKARKYAGSNPSRVVKAPPTWPDAVRGGLLTLASVNPLSAKLGEAWYLQKGLADVDPCVWEEPWNDKKRQYWRKERVDLALIQIAGRCQQRPIWCGIDDLVELSGGNILTFISICQHVWGTWMQVGSASKRDRNEIRRIDDEVQAIGVFKASDSWLNKVSQETGRSGDRMRFVRWLGEYLSRTLNQDHRMSNPGHNGFSIAEDELDDDPQVKQLLLEMSDYGNLVQTPHTTKEKDRRSRQKWYLREIFCPQFKLPSARRKEPKYISVSEMREWMALSGIVESGRPIEKVRPAAMPLEGLPLFQNLERS